MRASHNSKSFFCTLLLVNVITSVLAVFEDEKTDSGSEWRSLFGDELRGASTLPAAILDFQNRTRSLLSIFNATANAFPTADSPFLSPSKLDKKAGAASVSLQHLKGDPYEKVFDPIGDQNLSPDLDDAAETVLVPTATLKTGSLKNWKTRGSKENTTRELLVLKEGGKLESSIEAVNLKDDLETWEAPAIFRKRFPYYLAGYDDSDRPVWIAEMGKYEVRAVMEEGAESVDILRKYVKQAAYRIIRSLEEQSRPEREVSKAIFIIDFDGLTLNQMGHAPTILFALNLARSYKDLILKRLHATIVINVNYFAQLLINMVRPVLGGVMDKTQVYGVDTEERKKWMAVLYNLLPPETIPSWYGGYPSYKPVKVYD